MIGARFRDAMHDKARRYTIEKWFWVANVPTLAFVYFVFPPAWEKVSIPYLAIVSVYALVSTASGNAEAAKAAASISEDA